MKQDDSKRQRASMIVWFGSLGLGDVALVGGKNASLGELVRHLSAQGVKVPDGFATTADAFWQFVEANQIGVIIRTALADFAAGKSDLARTGDMIRQAFLRGEWPSETADAICAAYRELSEKTGRNEMAVAVRSSATAEDLPDASFAGQQETFLNIRGESALLDACRRCYASLFTDRAIAYRQAKGFDHSKIALSIGVQEMVRSDIGGAGVMFSIDTETGFDKVVLITAAWGLGENVVQGTVDPDEYMVFKPFLDKEKLVPVIEKSLGKKAQKMVYGAAGETPTRNVPTSLEERDAFVLDDPHLLTLALWACRIEEHYGRPMDIEWAQDGETGDLYIVQARPETVQSRREGTALKSYHIESKGRKLVSGLSIGNAVATGRTCFIDSPHEIDRFVDGSILVTGTTDPDWVPIMKRAAAIVTDHGGRTSHAAIVSRELGIPAVVGCGNATRVLHDAQDVTVSCAEGDDGFVYAGHATYHAEDLNLDQIPETRTQVMLNLANPSAAFRWWRLPSDGVGLARMEFVVSNHIKIHPMALVRFDELKDHAAKSVIAQLTRLYYYDKKEYFVDRLARGLARIAASQYPRPVIVRMSDFKSNEYAGLLGGAEFEPDEANPMIGFRGASRYYSPRYKEGFALECRAIRRLRTHLGFDNVIIMIPFCRTVQEADSVLAVMKENGLERGQDGLEVYVMCEIPSNVILASEFAERFDGFSIGSNDLTQLTLGVDRDSSELAELFDERNDAVKWMIRTVIAKAHESGAKVGLCGEAPSNDMEFAAFLAECGIDSVSVSPDSFVKVRTRMAVAEGRDIES